MPKIQSLSVVVPNKQCINKCAFCVSRMNPEDYKNQMDDNLPFFDLYLKDYIKCLEWARNNGCNVAMLTGNSEPQQNRKFLTYFGLFMQLMKNPFYNIEMQTTGVLLDDPYLRFLRNHVGVNVISLSLSALQDYKNHVYNRSPRDLRVNIKELCESILKYDFTLRLSLNLTDYYEMAEMGPKEIFNACKELGANQVTFRVLYRSFGDPTPQDEWIKEHAMDPRLIDSLNDYIEAKGRKLEELEFGMQKYSVDGMSIVLDNDCMSTEAKSALKYVILRPDCKLYSKWDDPASRMF